MPFLSANLFPSPPPPPHVNHPHPHPPPPPLPIPKRNKPTKKPSQSTPPPPPPPPVPPALRKSFHSRTKYHRPLPPAGGVISSDGDRSVVVGDSGVSYLLPGAPFHFQFSYSETPKAKPLAIREPAFLPFAPPTMPRPWTGKAPLLSKKDKERKKKIRVFRPIGEEDDYDEEGEGEGEGEGEEGVGGMVLRTSRGVGKMMGRGSVGDGRSREEILGAPLSRREVKELVRPWLSSNRQLNLGRDGLTHNMLEMVHTHWRRQEVCKVRCRGVPTVDMDNVCYHLEEKTGGKIIHRVGGVVYLFRGRHYNPHTRPRYPVMLWKPAAPVYPKLIQDAPEGLTKAEADELRSKGKNLLPICKLAKNGIYITLVKDVRDAFEGSSLVKINCQGLSPSDYKKIGAKLKELVPCVLLSFDEEQILMWRGKDWKPRFRALIPSGSKLKPTESGTSSDMNSSGPNGASDEYSTKLEISNPKMFSLWRRALDSNKAVLLDEVELSPDSLLKMVDKFEGVTLEAEHSYPALIVSGERGTMWNNSDDDNDNVQLSGMESDEDFEDYDMNVSGVLEGVESSIPYGSLPIDSIAGQLSPE